MDPHQHHQAIRCGKIYPERTDSICNGADDDGLGLGFRARNRRGVRQGKHQAEAVDSLHLADGCEEKGLWGSEYFTNHPTVPRDSIIADLNIDMVGRGEATDVTGAAKGDIDPATGRPGAGPLLHGGPNYVQLVGARRLSTGVRPDLAEAR